MWDELPWEAVNPSLLKVLGVDQGFSYFNVPMNCMGILLGGWFYFRRSVVGPGILHF